MIGIYDNTIVEPGQPLRLRTFLWAMNENTSNTLFGFGLHSALCWWSLNDWLQRPWNVTTTKDALPKLPLIQLPEDNSGVLLYPPIFKSGPPLSSIRWEQLLLGAQDLMYIELLLQQRESLRGEAAIRVRLHIIGNARI